MIALGSLLRLIPEDMIEGYASGTDASKHFDQDQDCLGIATIEGR